MKSKFEAMSRQELRAYMLEHREDEEAFQLYLDQVMAEPGEIYPAPQKIEDLSNFRNFCPKNDKIEDLRLMGQSITLRSLDEQDFYLWLEDTAIKLRAGKFREIDIETLVEEIEALGRSEKQELENRLDVLLAHLLKRIYIDSAYDNRGWELTIQEQRKMLRRLIKKSPSLKRYFTEVFDEVWQDALSQVRLEYRKVSFPDTWDFPSDLDSILSVKFWE
jgi:hypothetical protein